mgnify:CR=1 FL=1
MEIISFEKKAFEEVAAKLDYFVRRMDNLCRLHGEKKAGIWMDNHAVCQNLRISPRTLQTLRDNGTLAFSKIATAPTTVRKMWSGLLWMWRRGGRKRDGKAKAFDSQNITKKQIVWVMKSEKRITSGYGISTQSRQAPGLARKVVQSTPAVRIWR